MPAVQVVFQDQPITFPVSAVVAGGQVVAADQTATTVGTVTPAGANSKLVIGVALRDAAPAGTDPATDAAARPPQTSVARRGSVVPVTYAASSIFGDRLKAAALGQVTVWVDGTDDVEDIIGINVDDGGTVAAAAVGLMSIGVS